jgi:O-antigen/teichoic acid export membrane protein
MNKRSAAESAALPQEYTRPLRHGVARAALASGAVETVSRVLTIVLSIATARALQPSQVGILGLAVIVIGIISLVAACSETAGVISRSEGTDSQHAFAATAIRGLISAILVTGAYLCLPVITRLLVSAERSEGELVGLIRILLWIPIVELIAGYPRVLLQRRLDLTYLAGVSLFQVSSHVGLSVLLLWQGLGAQGVAYSSLIASIINATAVWLRVYGRRWPKRNGFPTRSVWRDVLTGNSKVFAGGFVGYLNGRVDNLLVAGAIGPTAMSFYGMAWTASRMAPQVLGQAFGFVLIPALAQIQTDEKRTKRALAESVQHSYLLLAPLSAGLFVLAPFLVQVALGAKWLPMVPCLRVMCIAMLVGPLISASNALLVASGRAHFTGLAAIAQLAVLATTIIPLSQRWGTVGAAVADLCAVLFLTITLIVVTPLFREVLMRNMLSCIGVPVISALMAAFIAQTAPLQIDDVVLTSLAKMGLIVVIYPVILSLLGGRGALLELVTLIRDVAQQSFQMVRVFPSQS